MLGALGATIAAIRRQLVTDDDELEAPALVADAMGVTRSTVTLATPPMRWNAVRLPSIRMTPSTAVFGFARMRMSRSSKVTRIAMGIPVGSDIEYTDEITMLKAMEGRREL